MNVSTALVNSLDARALLSECKSDLQNRLDGWKEISLYLKRSVRCVQRWERNECLPVHRHKHLHGMTVYAFRHELDAWWHGRSNSVASENALRANRSQDKSNLPSSSPALPVFEATDSKFPVNGARSEPPMRKFRKILPALRQLCSKRFAALSIRKFDAVKR